MKCKSCDTLNPDDAKFCRRCGKKLNKERKVGCLQLVAIFILIFIICAVLNYLINNQNSPYNTASLIEEVNEQEKASYLTISDNDVRLSSLGESETVTINTDGKWKIGTEAKDWVSLSKDGNRLTISVEKNKGKERSDYFTIVADDLEERINITQYASTDPFGEIKNVWVDHNTYDNNGLKGMRIHISFTVHNMLNRAGMVSAYFYNSDGTALLDTNGLYKSTDGCVSVGEAFNPSYENSDYSDFTIFMPYSEFHLNSSTNLYFKVLLWYNQEKIGEYSEKIYVTYTI